MSEDIASLAIRIDSLEARNAARDLQNLEQQGRRTATSTSALSEAYKLLGMTIGGVGLAGLAKDILDTNRQMESLRAALTSVTGSVKEAQKAFSFIQDFAKTTPYEIKGLTQNFITLQNMGIKPTQQVMEALTNQASKLGGSQDTLSAIVLQLGQAYSKGKLQMEDMVILMERGVPVMDMLEKVTGKNASALSEMSKKGELTRDVIDKLIIKMGELSSGSNARAMDTLNGRISSLADAWHTFEDALLNDTSETLIRRIVENWTLVIEDFTNKITGGDLMGRIDKQIAETQQNLANMESGGVKSVNQTVPYKQNAKDLEVLLGLKSDLAKSDAEELNRDNQRIELEKKKTAETKKLLDEQTKAEESSKKAAEIVGDLTRKNFELTHSKREVIKADLIAQGVSGKELESALKLADQNEKLSHQTVRHTAAKRSHVAVMSTEQREAQALDRAYKSLDESLKKQLYLSRIATEESHNASLEYDLSEGSLKDLIETKKLYLLQMAQEIQNNEITAKETEAKKSEMDGLIDKYNQLTLSASEYYRTKLEGEGIKGAAQEPLVKQFEKNSATETNIANFEKSSEALQQYAADIDNAEQSMAGLGATTNDVFAAANGGISQVIGAFDAMIKSLDGNSKALDDLAKKQKAVSAIQPSMDKDKYLKDIETKAKLTEQYAKKEQALNNETVNLYLDGFNNVVGAAAAMYQDNEAAQIAAQSIMLVTLGIQAVMAVVNQASQGDVYTAFARMAAMAASVGALVASVGGSSGGASVPPAPPNSADTGTVLGDSKAQSNSVGNVYDLLKNIHAEEYAELRGINKGVAALSGGILGAVTKTFQTGAITGTSAPHLGESKYKLVSGGLATASVTLADILGGNADIGGQMFTTEQHQGGSKKKPTFSFNDMFTPMAASVTESLKGMFSGIGNTMKGVSDQLGKDIGKDLNMKLNRAIIPALKIDIMGLSGEDAVKKVNAVISTAMDTVATQVFGDIISEYQQLGEGMLETAVRIVAEVAVVRDALSQSGMSMAGNSIELADSLVQAAGGLEQFQQQFEGFYDAFFTDLEKQDRLQQRLNETFAEVYMLLPRTREEYKKVLSALDLNNKAEQERYSLMLQLSGAADSYYSMIESKSSASSEITSAAMDQEIQLLRLQGKEIEAVTIERKRELDAMDESLRAMQALIYTYSDLSGTLTTAYNTAADLLTSTFTKFFNLAKSLVAYRDALKVGDLSTGSPESKYNANKAAFEKAAGIVAGGKGTTDVSEQRYKNALESLQGLSEKFLASSRDYNASGKDYGMDYKSVLTALNQGAKGSLNIASNAEKQLNALNDMVSGLTTLNLSIIKLDGSIGKVDGSVDAVGARVRVSNEQLRDVNGNIVTGNRHLNIVETRSEQTVKKLTAADVSIKIGNNWLKLVDNKTGLVNDRIKDSNFFIKDGNHYLSLVDKNTGKLNESFIDANGNLSKIYTNADNWLEKLSTKADKTNDRLSISNISIRDGNKWLRLVDSGTGLVNEKLKNSNLWIKEGNHYLQLVDKNTGKVNEKLINVDGSVKKVYQSTDKAPSATDLVRQAINGSGGLKDATKDVKQSVNYLNSKSGLSGAIGSVQKAVGSVHDAVKGMTAAIVAINKLQSDRDKAALEAQKAEAKAARERAEAERIMREKQQAAAAAALLANKQKAYNSVYGLADKNAMEWNARNGGVDTKYAQGWSDWGLSMLGAFDPNMKFENFGKLYTLMTDFKKFLVASGQGKPYAHDGAYYAAQFAQIKGHANGLEYVPYDGYMAKLHQGEKIQTRFEANDDAKETKRIYLAILEELKMANAKRGAESKEVVQKLDKVVNSTESQTRALKRAIS